MQRETDVSVVPVLRSGSVLMYLQQSLIFYLLVLERHGQYFFYPSGQVDIYLNGRAGSGLVMNLILLKPSELTEQHNHSGSSKLATLTKNDERSVHIIKHLRKKSGDQVSIGIVGEFKYNALVQLNDDGSVTLLVQDDTKVIQEQNEPEITVLLALPFPARLKALWPVLSSFCAVTRIIVVKGQLSNEEFCESSKSYNCSQGAFLKLSNISFYLRFTSA